MKKLRQLGISILLILTLLLTGCTQTGNVKPEVEAPKYNTEHTSVDFNELKYERPDTEAISAMIENTKALVQKQNAQDEVFKSYDEILTAIAAMDTMQTVASIHSSMDVKDEYYSTEDQFLTNEYVKLDNKMLDLTKSILESEYGNAFIEKMGEEFINRYEINSELNSPEIESLVERETTLVNDYTLASVENYTTTYNGVEVGLDDLDFNDPNVATPYFEIYEKKNAVTGEIYRELMQVRVEIAKKLGYDSYTEYAYAALGYDFNPEDSKKLQEYVVKNIAPLYQKISAKYDQEMMLAAEEITATFDEGIPTLEKAIQAEFPEYMMTALNFMKDNNMYLYTNSNSAAQGAYTTFINEYAAPFMFVNTALYTDPSTVFHEFGHYYNFFHYPILNWNDGNDLNLAEVHSQGLEVLMYPYYEELYGENAKLMEYSNILGMLGSILQGCAEDEFQQKVFENPTMSLDEMNQLHGEIFAKYMGYPVFYEWVDIHHHFETPFYYISYATSAVSALELWSIAEKDRAKALDIYDNITKFAENSHYLDALDYVGLSNPFNSKVISTIEKAIKAEMGL